MVFDPTKYGLKTQSISNQTSVFSTNQTKQISPLKQSYQKSAQETGATFPASPVVSAAQAPVEALKAVGNVPSSAINLVKGTLQAINPVNIYKTLKQAGDDYVALQKEAGGKSQANRLLNQAFGQMAKDFGNSVKNLSLENVAVWLHQKSVNDPLLIPTLLEMGAAKLGKTKELAKVGETIASPITKPSAFVAEKAGQATKEISTGISGAITGLGKAGTQEALKGTESFTQAMRGKITPTQFVEDARAGLGLVKEQRATSYQTQLAKVNELNPAPYKLTPVYDKAKELVNQFRIGLKEDGNLDFSRSPLVKDQDKVNSIIKLVETWGTKADDLTVSGIDSLKQQLRLFREPTNPTLNKFVDDIANSAKSVIKDAKGYQKLESDYANQSAFIDELEKTLSLKESATPDQAITKLNSLLRDNADYRRLLADEFKQITGKDLTATAAGLAANRLTPTGLSKFAQVGAGGLAIGAGLTSQLIPIIALTSPRVMAEFFRSVGIGVNKIKPILNDINNFRIPQGLKNVKLKAGLSIEDVSGGKASVNSLLQEAKKYKTAEEFVKAKATLSHRSVTPDIKIFKPNESGIFFTKDAYGERYTVSGKKDIHITNAYIDLKKPFLASRDNVADLYKKNYGLDEKRAYELADEFIMSDTTAREQVKGFIEDNYDGMIIPEDWDGGLGTIESVVAFKPEQIKTKSQLTDIWNKAHNK